MGPSGPSGGTGSTGIAGSVGPVPKAEFVPEMDTSFKDSFILLGN
jgi:hypothetical protein